MLKDLVITPFCVVSNLFKLLFGISSLHTVYSFLKNTTLL